MANMESLERASSYFNMDVGTNTKAQTTKKTEKKTTEKALKISAEKYQQSTLEKEKGTKEVTPQQLEEAVEKANKQIKQTNISLEFKFYEDVNRYSVKLKDKKTDEVIREYPSEDSMKALENIWKVAGIIIDESI